MLDVESATCSMSGGELFEKVSDESNRMTEQEAIEYIRQVCEGLQHMHENNYVHLDLKVILCSLSQFSAIIVDFSPPVSARKYHVHY